MPVTSITTDPDALTMTVVGDYEVTVERLWEAYADPRAAGALLGSARVPGPVPASRHGDRR